ncbi:MAG: GlsB/YeaQ/YmgE family stress response membrane protein [Hyphomicrobiales bacterium]
MGIIFWIIVGGLAGWLAEKITNSDHTLLMNIGIGIAGALVGGFLFGLFGLQFGGWIGSTITALVGALVLLYGYRFIQQRQG